jgi:hypothetical protein
MTMRCSFHNWKMIYCQSMDQNPFFSDKKFLFQVSQVYLVQVFDTQFTLTLD